MVQKNLVGKIALVTGATRGIGKGIAVQLGEHGATVYITGRTLTAPKGKGSLEETAQEIRDRGGKCIPLQVDHEDDQAIANLFATIEKEQNGRLDILVNNAYKGVGTIFDGANLKFWEMKPEVWDDINNVGLRNHYICTVYASRMMVPRRQGLIVNVSSFGGMRYLFNVPYGIGKCACDRMAQDCGIELKKHNVTMVSLWPGAVKTELVNEKIDKNNKSVDAKVQERMAAIFGNGESPEFSGMVVAAMAADSNIHKQTSKVINCSEYAQANNIVDIDGRVIPSFREIGFLLGEVVLPAKLKFLASYVPRFVRVPQFVMDIANSKF